MAKHHYRGRLTASEIAHGVNAAVRNARQLVADAELLLEHERFPSAASIAILAIEEAGKVGILQVMSAIPDDDEKNLLAAWKDYRSHKAKNVKWILVKLAHKLATKLPNITVEDFRPVFDSKSDHPEKLDKLKQIGFYTDCYGDNRRWSEPQKVINATLAQGLVTIAKILCPARETSVREIELWQKHVGPLWGTPMPLMSFGAWRFHSAMHEEGLDQYDLEELGRLFGVKTEAEKD